MQTWLILGIVALVFWGISGVTQKLSTNCISFERSFLWFALAFAGLSLAIVLTVPLDWHLTPSLVALAALGGLLNGLGALTSFAALEHGGKASVVIPLISVYPLITIAGAWLLLGERLTNRQIAGVVCALVAVVLLAQEAPAQSPPKGA
jgi:bacterial/archaeal transporter family protein